MWTASRSFTWSREEHSHANQPSAETVETLKPWIVGRLSDESFITLFMVGVLIVVFGIASIAVPNFKIQNIVNLVTNNWFIIILGIGVTFLLITGNFDMSVGGVIALTGVLAVFLPGSQCIAERPGERSRTSVMLPWRLPCFCAMGVGGINAFFIARLKVLPLL